MHEDCCGGHGVPRRQVLQAGLAAAAVGTLGAATAAKPAAAATGTAGAGAIDIHAHYFPQAYLELFNSEAGRRAEAHFAMTDKGFTYKTPVAGNPLLPMKFIDLNLRLADMDAQGVRVHALSLTAPMVYWGDAELNHQLAMAWNDAAIAAHKAHPDRFVVLVTLPMLEPDRAVDELTRVGKQEGVRGVYLGTNIEDRDLDDPMFQPVFAKIEALSLPVFLHPVKTIASPRLRPFYLGNLIGNPLDTAVCAAHLIFGGVMDRYPNLEVNLPHAGGVLPILVGRWDHGRLVRAELKHMTKPPSEYLKRFTYDTVAHSKPIMDYVISQVGADRIMVGSDYCFDMGYTQPVSFVDGLGWDDTTRAQVLHGNAARILKL